MTAARVTSKPIVFLDPATGKETARFDADGLYLYETLVVDGDAACGVDFRLPVLTEGATGSTVTVALAAGAADTMTITITVKDALGATVAALHELEVWLSDSATTGVLTSTSYSGALTATTGAILTALTAKKHVKAVTAASGILVLSLVASGKPATEYVYVRKPIGAGVVTSAASGTSWGA